MSYSFELRQEAISELTDSVIWYEEQQSCLGLKLREAINDKLKLICRSPFHYKKSHKNFHEALTDTFPFLIVYHIDDEKKRS